MKACMIFGDLLSDSTDEQYPTVNICESCISEDAKLKEHSRIVNPVGDYNQDLGTSCEFCGIEAEDE